MSNSDENKPIDVTPEKAIAWIANKLGKKSQKQVATEIGVSPRTAFTYIHDFDEYIKQSPEYQAIAPSIAKMIPKALGAYDKALDNTDERGNVDSVAAKTADNVFKMIGILIDRSKNEHNIINQSDEDLARQLQELIAANSQNIAGDDCYVADEPEGTVIDDSAGDETPDA
mgnify:CR=1 FL=1